MSFIKNAKDAVSPGGKHGLSSKETRDPIGYAVAGLNVLAQSALIDKLKLRKATEQIVFSTTSRGFKAMAATSRTFAKKGSKSTDQVDCKRPNSREKADEYEQLNSCLACV